MKFSQLFPHEAPIYQELWFSRNCTSSVAHVKVMKFSQLFPHEAPIYQELWFSRNCTSSVAHVKVGNSHNYFHMRLQYIRSYDFSGTAQLVLPMSKCTYPAFTTLRYSYCEQMSVIPTSRVGIFSGTYEVMKFSQLLPHEAPTYQEVGNSHNYFHMRLQYIRSYDFSGTAQLVLPMSKCTYPAFTTLRYSYCEQMSVIPTSRVGIFSGTYEVMKFSQLLPHEAPTYQEFLGVHIPHLHLSGIVIVNREVGNSHNYFHMRLQYIRSYDFSGTAQLVLPMSKCTYPAFTTLRYSYCEQMSVIPTSRVGIFSGTYEVMKFSQLLPHEAPTYQEVYISRFTSSGIVIVNRAVVSRCTYPAFTTLRYSYCEQRSVIPTSRVGSFSGTYERSVILTAKKVTKLLCFDQYTNTGHLLRVFKWKMIESKLKMDKDKGRPGEEIY
uniref:Uncharacterized protein n=1 Tax=Salix viminalis TaxID=40686 RepID=A0A6N2MFX2_SALVM